MKKCFFYLFMYIFLFSSCTKELDSVQFSDKVIVEGYLIRGNMIKIKVSKLIPYERIDSISLIAGLNIEFSNGNSTIRMIDSGNGIYSISKDVMYLEVGKSYSFKFRYNDLDISASTSIPPKPNDFKMSATTLKVPSFSGGGFPSFPDPIKCTWNNLDRNYYLVTAANYEVNPSPIVSGDFSPPSFRTDPLQTNSYDLSFQRFSYLGNHFIILYRIQEDYAALYKNSGTTSLNITNVNSKIVNGLGIFTGINSDTLNLLVYK